MSQLPGEVVRFYVDIHDIISYNALVGTNHIVFGSVDGDEWLVGIGDDGPPEPFDNKGEVTVHSTRQGYSRPGSTEELRQDQVFVLVQAHNGRTQLELYTSQKLVAGGDR